MKAFPLRVFDATPGKPVIACVRIELSVFLRSALLRPVSYTHLDVYKRQTTAYAILRHNGVEIGKRDFMGPG